MHNIPDACLDYTHTHTHAQTLVQKKVPALISGIPLAWWELVGVWMCVSVPGCAWLASLRELSPKRELWHYLRNTSALTCTAASEPELQHNLVLLLIWVDGFPPLVMLHLFSVFRGVLHAMLSFTSLFCNWNTYKHSSRLSWLKMY